MGGFVKLILLFVYYQISETTHLHHSFKRNNSLHLHDSSEWQNLSSLCPFGFEIEGELIRCAIPAQDFPKINSSLFEVEDDVDIQKEGKREERIGLPKSGSFGTNLLHDDRQLVLKSKAGNYLRHHFLNVVDRPRLKTRNPCYAHKSTDKVQGVLCLPYFYILGPQKCGTTDTFERIMRHPDVVRFNPKIGEQLEPQLWTNQIDDGFHSHKHTPAQHEFPLLYKNSLRQFGRHSQQLLVEKMIGGDASASLMYRIAVPKLPTATLLHAVQPDARLIAVLRDPVERTYSDFRYFFHCGTSRDTFKMCPSWFGHIHSSSSLTYHHLRWSVPSDADLTDPAVRFHKIVQIEIREFSKCLHGDLKREKLFFGKKTSAGLLTQKVEEEVANRTIGDEGQKDNEDLESGEDQVEEEDGPSSLALIYENSTTLDFCKRRPDLNRDYYLNKCYSGRAVLSLYAAFLVDWLQHFPGTQLLALPLEGLDQSPHEWIGGIYKFLKLKQPSAADWEVIVPSNAQIKRKTANAIKCGNRMVKFGSMKPATKVLLRRFFTPWNDALRLLLLEKNVATVPGYPIEKPAMTPKYEEAKHNEDGDIMFTPKEEDKLVKVDDKELEAPERRLAVAPKQRSMGLWWWDYSRPIVFQTSSTTPTPSSSAGQTKKSNSDPSSNHQTNKINIQNPKPRTARMKMKMAKKSHH